MWSGLFIREEGGKGRIRNPARVGEVRTPPPACYNYSCGRGIVSIMAKQERCPKNEKRMDRQVYGRWDGTHSDDDLQCSRPWPTIYPEAQWHRTRYRKQPCTLCLAQAFFPFSFINTSNFPRLRIILIDLNLVLLLLFLSHGH